MRADEVEGASLVASSLEIVLRKPVSAVSTPTPQSKADVLVPGMMRAVVSAARARVEDRRRMVT